MPYKVEEGAIERAKYRAKMAVREAAHPAESRTPKLQWRWASAVAVVALLVVGAIGFAKLIESSRKPLSPMEELIAAMQSAPDEVITEWTADVVYYGESDINSPM